VGVSSGRRFELNESGKRAGKRCGQARAAGSLTARAHRAGEARVRRCERYGVENAELLRKIHAIGLRWRMSSAHIAHIRRSMRHACHGRQAAATRAGHRSWPSLRRAGSVRRTVVSVAAKMRNGVPIRKRPGIVRRFRSGRCVAR